jgi:hypothetical protein
MKLQDNQEITLDWDFAKSLRNAIDNYTAWDRKNKEYKMANPLEISTRGRPSTLTNGEVGVAINIELADTIIGQIELSPAEALLLATNITNTVRNMI